jgi:HEXXH motif-containing protein
LAKTARVENLHAYSSLVGALVVFFRMMLKPEERADRVALSNCKVGLMTVEIYEGFSMPNHGATRALLDLVVRETGTSAVRRALAANKSTIIDGSIGLVECLEKWVEAPDNAFWHPTIGQLKAQLTSEHCSIPLKWLVEIGCIAQLGGASASWSFNLQTHQRLWIGRWLLPEIVSGAVHGDQNEFCLRARRSDGQLTALKLSRDMKSREWNADQLPQNTFELPKVDLTPIDKVFLVPAEMLDETLLPEFPGAQFQQCDKLSGFAHSLKQTAELISLYAPEYLNWVADVVSFIAPLVVPPGIIGSSSTPNHSGLVSISEDAGPLMTAELLVHEASHQYFFVAACLGEMCECSEERLYYSRIAQRERPIERILVAYHALGNMLLFYDRCLEGGVACEKRMAYILTQMKQLSETLDKADALTLLGRALWLPLSEKARHIGTKIRETASYDLSEAERNMARIKGA